MSRFVRKDFLALMPYSPGQQPEEKMIKLNTNENPYPPSPGAVDAIGKISTDELRLYWDPEASEAKNAIAEHYDIESSRVMVTNGSDEALAFAFHAFGEKICFPEITYSFYKVFAMATGSHAVTFPLKKDMIIDITDYKKFSGTVILANPNAPTGKALCREQIREIVLSDPDRLVIIDEAYVDFGAESCISLVKEYDNILVIQTMSKSRSLAAMRIGFALGSRDVIADLNKIKYSFNPYSMDPFATAAAKAAIEDEAYFIKTTAEIIRTREKTAAGLRDLGLEVIPSKTNFLLVSGGREYFEKLKEKKILVRYWDENFLRNWVRISIGTPGQMEKLLKATKEIICEKVK
ncbi:MAG TPA: histidinol-phosphate transaminase [Bacillota bacterium]|nr:histidinol-phosphate transaminase [Bacillota bacterium]